MVPSLQVIPMPLGIHGALQEEEGEEEDKERE